MEKLKPKKRINIKEEHIIREFSKVLEKAKNLKQIKTIKKEKQNINK